MKIALIGYGKMGKEIEKIALGRGHEIVSIIDVDNQEDFGLVGGTWRRSEETLYRRRQDTVLVVQLQSGSKHILCRQQVPRKDNEPIPCL